MAVLVARASAVIAPKSAQQQIESKADKPINIDQFAAHVYADWCNANVVRRLSGMRTARLLPSQLLGVLQPTAALQKAVEEFNRFLCERPEMALVKGLQLIQSPICTDGTKRRVLEVCSKLVSELSVSITPQDASGDSKTSSTSSIATSTSLSSAGPTSATTSSSEIGGDIF
jgi:hypothetical protein